MRETIIQYRGYIIRSMGNVFIATPTDTTCYWSPSPKKIAIKQLKFEIDCYREEEGDEWK